MKYQVAIKKRLSATDLNAINDWIYTNLNLVRIQEFNWICNSNQAVWYFRNRDDALQFKMVWG